MLRQATLSRPLRNDVVQCTACEHWCAVAPGEAGICGVRRNIDGTLYLVVYGRAVAANVDPIEKKPLYHFLPSSTIFSIGTYGCNFRCSWCQNWSISQHRSFDPESAQTGQELPPDEIVAACLANGISSIAFTYNEPIVFFEYAYDTAVTAHAAGLRTVFVSSGFETTAALETIVPYLDAANIDLKAFREETYGELCGGRLQPVLRNIEHLVNELNIWTEVTTLVIPDLNDSDGELRDIAEFLASVSPDIPWHVSAFTPQYHMQDRPPTSAERLRRAWEIGREAGLRYVYTGNIWGNRLLANGSQTRCPNCDQVLIERQGYRTGVNWYEPGRCPNCDTEIAGVWS